MYYKDRIESKPDVMLGKPVIKGSRITVATILQKLSDGAEFEELLTMYPTLTREDINAALQYASSVISNEEVIILKAS